MNMHPIDAAMGPAHATDEHGSPVDIEVWQKPVTVVVIGGARYEFDIQAASALVSMIYRNSDDAGRDHIRRELDAVDELDDDELDDDETSS